jgi:hypothetical protein
MTSHRVEDFFGDWITFEEIRGIDIEAVTSKVIGKELNWLVSWNERGLEGEEDGVRDCSEARCQRRLPGRARPCLSGNLF